MYIYVKAQRWSLKCLLNRRLYATLCSFVTVSSAGHEYTNIDLRRYTEMLKYCIWKSANSSFRVQISNKSGVVNGFTCRGTYWTITEWITRPSILRLIQKADFWQPLLKYIYYIFRWSGEKNTDEIARHLTDSHTQYTRIFMSHATFLSWR